MSNESYHCGNCGRTAGLDVRGKCAGCGSDAVMAEALLPDEATPKEPDVKIV